MSIPLVSITGSRDANESERAGPSDAHTRYVIRSSVRSADGAVQECERAHRFSAFEALHARLSVLAPEFPAFPARARLLKNAPHVRTERESLLQVFLDDAGAVASGRRHVRAALRDFLGVPSDAWTEPEGDALQDVPSDRTRTADGMVSV